MELTVYRQSSKTRPDGTIVYKGEDARPYVDGQLLFVADGLGGAAAIRHQKIKPELFESDKLVQTLFDGVYEDISDERFVKYVTDSFFELFAVKECYTDNVNNIKKSGYFASRIVTAILLHEMLYNTDCQANALFEVYAKALQEGQGEEFLKRLGTYFKELIQRNLRKAAANANLVYESSYSGLALLGSTLCATVYREHEDHVEAIYLTAGDSRPYVWSLKDGLCQVLADEEGKDGGMTNYIKANEDADFNIRCHYFQFAKPCVLFNASDGCFDSGRFVSQLGYEKLIVELAQETQSMEQLSQALTDFFVDYGRHDDSSTMAMKLFGYDSFEAFQESAKQRAQILDSDYFVPMPDILEADHVAEHERAEDMLSGKLAALKERFQGNSDIRAYCARDVQYGQYAPFVEALHAIDGQIEAEKQKIRTAKENLENVIAQNFVRFKPFLAREEDWKERYICSRLRGVEGRYKENANDYISRITGYKQEFDSAVHSMGALLEQIYQIGVPEGFEDFDEISYGIVESCEQSMEELFAFFNGLKEKKQELVRKLAQQRMEYINRNVKLAQQHPQDVKALRKLVQAGQLDPAAVGLFADDLARLTGERDSIASAQEQIRRLETEAKADAYNAAVDAYWESDHIAIISRFVADADSPMDEAARSETKAVLDEYRAQTAEMKEKCELQKALFAKYEDGYSKYMGGITQ